MEPEVEVLVSANSGMEGRFVGKDWESGMEKDHSLVEVGSLAAEVGSRQLEDHNLRCAQEECLHSLEVEGKVMEGLDVRSWVAGGIEVAAGSNHRFDGHCHCSNRC